MLIEHFVVNTTINLHKLFGTGFYKLENLNRMICFISSYKRSEGQKRFTRPPPSAQEMMRKLQLLA